MPQRPIPAALGLPGAAGHEHRGRGPALRPRRHARRRGVDHRRDGAGAARRGRRGDRADREQPAGLRDRDRGPAGALAAAARQARGHRADPGGADRGAGHGAAGRGHGLLASAGAGAEPPLPAGDAARCALQVATLSTAQAVERVVERSGRGRDRAGARGRHLRRRDPGRRRAGRCPQQHALRRAGPEGRSAQRRRQDVDRLQRRRPARGAGADHAAVRRRRHQPD